MKKSRSTNPLLLQLIENLKKKSYEEKAPIWRDIARRLAKSASNRAEVNIDDIARHTKNNEVIAVPGKVLGSGKINHKVTAAALGFSPHAREKISAAGGKCLSYEELLKSNPKGTKVKIMG